MLNNNNNNDISLIKYVSQSKHQDAIEDILFNKFKLSEDYKKERALQREEELMDIAALNTEEKKNDYAAGVSSEEESEEKKHLPLTNQPSDVPPEEEYAPPNKPRQKEETISWIELACSAIVESFSALDI